MDFDLEYDYEAVFAKDRTLKKSDIEELKKWVQSLDSESPVPKNLTNKQLLIFHIGCLQVLDDTKKCITTHYTQRSMNPVDFDNRDATSDLLRETQEVQEYIYLPEKTDKGYGILLHRLHDFNVERYNYQGGCRWNSMSYDAVMNEEGPYNGIILLFDLRGTKFGHITRVPLGYMSKYAQYVQEGLNGRIEAIHVLNAVPLVDIIIKVVRQFVKGELMKRMVLHPPDMDWEVFYRDIIPKRCLPSDFGGDLPDTQTLNKQNTERVLRNKAFFIAEENQRHLYLKKNEKKPSTDKLRYIDID